MGIAGINAHRVAGGGGRPDGGRVVNLGGGRDTHAGEWYSSGDGVGGSNISNGNAGCSETCS